MILAINELIKLNGGPIERILWVDPDNIVCYTINILDDKATPQKKSVKEIKSLISEGVYEKIEEVYSFPFSETDIKENHKLKRDSSWDIIKDLIICEPDIYIPEKRHSMVLDVCNNVKISRITVYKHLRRFWMRGKVKNALLPDYYNSGGKGKGKTGIKNGRKRKSSSVLGDGILIDDNIKRIFNMAINKFYNTADKNSLNTTYNLMLKEFFVDKVESEKSGELKLLPIDKLPTLRQFTYWYEKERNIKKEISSRKSIKKFELNHRAVLGKSDFNVIAPCSTFQIDATIGDVYLVSRYDRNKIIGRPVVYMVVDVFSRMITGMCVTLEGPSWTGAMMALANAAQDKVKFCKEYGIEIKESEWCSKYLPETLVADRGEIESKTIDTLASALHVSIKNTPPFRADWKGIVEQNFRLINVNYKSMVSGTINDDFRERGGHDYRLDAKLDIYEFTKIMIKCVLYHNNYHYLDSYERDEDMIRDNVEPIPCKLWDWGVKNRAGKIRSFPEDVVKLNLMPVDKATVTYRGIKFKGMLYSCNTAISEHWFERSKDRGSWKVDVSYDTRNMSNIYLRTENGLKYEVCNLLDHQERYKNKTLKEIEFLYSQEKTNKDSFKKEGLDAKVNLMADIEDIFNSAKKKTENYQESNISKTQKLKDIRNNRYMEKELDRKENAFVLGERINEEESRIIDFLKAQEVSKFNTEESDDEEDFIDNFDLLRKTQREGLKNGRKR